MHMKYVCDIVKTAKLKKKWKKPHKTYYYANYELWPKMEQEFGTSDKRVAFLYLYATWVFTFQVASLRKTKTFLIWHTFSYFYAFHEQQQLAMVFVGFKSQQHNHNSLKWKKNEKIYDLIDQTKITFLLTLNGEKQHISTKM